MTTHILLVEDNHELSEVLALDLELRGYAVTPVHNGEEALDQLHAMGNLFDVIVSDINMPDMDGFAFLEATHANPELQTIPFIFMTARNSHDDILSSKRLGADDYIIKPVTVDDLVISIENKLRRINMWKNHGQEKNLQVRRELMAIIQSKKDHVELLLKTYGADELALSDLEAMPDEFSQRALIALQQTSQQVSRLINHIVILTKISQAEIEPLARSALQPLELTAIIDNAVELLADEFDDDIQRVHFVPKPGANQRVYGRWDLATTIISEVIRNALIFSEEAVHIQTDITGQYGTIYVIDQGAGIPAEHAQAVWDRFYQITITGRPQQGAGLGLPVAYESLRLLHGHIEFEYVAGTGMVFSVYLPLVTG